MIFQYYTHEASSTYVVWVYQRVDWKKLTIDSDWVRMDGWWLADIDKATDRLSFGHGEILFFKDHLRGGKPNFQMGVGKLSPVEIDAQGLPRVKGISLGDQLILERMHASLKVIYDSKGHSEDLRMNRIQL